MLPTPIHRWHVPDLPTGVELWVKRDDMSGLQLSGNKVGAYGLYGIHIYFPVPGFDHAVAILGSKK